MSRNFRSWIVIQIFRRVASWKDMEILLWHQVKRVLQEVNCLLKRISDTTRRLGGERDMGRGNNLLEREKAGKRRKQGRRDRERFRKRRKRRERERELSGGVDKLSRLRWWYWKSLRTSQDGGAPTSRQVCLSSTTITRMQQIATRLSLWNGGGRGRSGGAEECWGGVGGGGIEIEWREWWRIYEGEGRKDRRERRYWNDGGGREEGIIKRRRGNGGGTVEGGREAGGEVKS